MQLPYDSHMVETNGLRLHVVTAGPHEGPPVILLHGFPEFWYCWQHQIPALAAAGLRVIVPDQRGYNLSDKPRGIAAYNLDILADDVLGLIDSSGHKKASIVGHDWGGAVAWWLANRNPDRVKRLAILNVAHHAVFGRNLRTNPDQQHKSRYIKQIQVPLLPELLMRRGNWKALTSVLTRTSLPDTFNEEDFSHYRTAWSQRRAFTSMLNWYRALVRARPAKLPDQRISMPTLIIWGADDRFFVPESGQQSLEFCDEGRLELIEDATHWVQHEQSERVNKLLVDFLGE